ncbi:hypothetical protein P8452_38839 [Trifolium repens]|nr:hypothetical protein P8452_38839 [Trifolium repens]
MMHILRCRLIRGSAITGPIGKECGDLWPRIASAANTNWYVTNCVVSMHAEFAALTGSKISALDIDAPVVRMAYSPTYGHIVVAVLQVGPTGTN